MPTWNWLKRNCVRAGRTPRRCWGIFVPLDQRRREAITQAERLKARRNELSQQVGALKKSRPGRERPSMDETRALKDKLDELDRTAAELDERLRHVAGARFRT